MKRLISGCMVVGLIAATVVFAEDASKPATAPAAPAAPVVEQAAPAPAAPAAEKPAAAAIEEKSLPVVKSAPPAAAPAQQSVARPPMPAEEDVTVTGKLNKMEHKRMVAGKEETMTMYALVEADGQRIRVPDIQKKVGETAAIDIEKYVGKDVKIVGKGRILTMGTKKHVSLRSITSVEEVTAKPAAPETAK